MRLAVSVLVLSILVAGCDSTSSSKQGPTTTTGPGCYIQVVSNAPPPEGVDWLDEGGTCVRDRIEEELKGRETTVRCEAVQEGRTSCRAGWTNSTNDHCTGEFNVQVHGTFIDRFVEVSDGPVICTTS
jgi:hypothetical protein